MKPVQIEFQRNGVDFFVGATQAEGFVGYEELTKITRGFANAILPKLRIHSPENRT